MLILIIALFTGATSALAFEPAGLWVVMPVAFAVMLGLIDRSKSVWNALLIGWLFGLGQFVVGLNWIATAFTYQTAMPPSLGWVAVVLISLYLAIYPALAAGLAWRIGRGNEVALVLALAGAWAVTEWLRAGLFTGFAWNPAAAALVPTPLIGVTALIGTYGLSALTVLIGSVIWLEIRRKWLPGVVIVLATAILWLLPASSVPDDPLTVRPIRIVQPNIGQQDKWRPGFADQAAQQLAALSNRPGGERPGFCSGPKPPSSTRSRTSAAERPRRSPRTSGRGRPSRFSRASISLPGESPSTPKTTRRSQGRPTAFSFSPPAGTSSAATTRRTWFRTANICRCGRSCRG
jgi:apolipoprotein N-acyltransferase